MLQNIKELYGIKLAASDGEIGHVKDFYFDDTSWVIRYLVADTGSWLAGRKVLLTPHAFGRWNRDENVLPINLTRKQIENSPSLDTHKPVSRQYEILYYSFYGWPAYWGGPHMWGDSAYPQRQGRWSGVPPHKKDDDPHLRSTNDVTGRTIQARDGEIGHVSDFVVDDENWAIRYLIVDTRNWWPGKKVLISTQWIERISWEESKVFIDLTREAVKGSPEYTEKALITRDYEEELHRHYLRERYWHREGPKRERKELVAHQ